MRKSDIDRRQLMGEAGVLLDSICDEEGYRKALDAIGIIGRYSKLDYILMAMLQCPEMTVVRTKKEWEKYGAAPKDEEDGIWFAADIPYKNAVNLWAKYDVSQVDFAEMPTKKVCSEGALLAIDAAKAVGGMENAFRAALHAEESETVDEAIGRLCSDLPEEWRSSVCYTIRKWFGVKAPDYDFSVVNPDDYPEALTDVCSRSAEIIKGMEKEFRQMRKPAAKKSGLTTKELEGRIEKLEFLVRDLQTEISSLKQSSRSFGM